MAIKLFANYEHGKVGIMDTPRGFAALRASHPSPLAAGALGISHASRAFSLSARRGGPCKLFEAHGLTAFGLFFVQVLTGASS